MMIQYTKATDRFHNNIQDYHTSMTDFFIKVRQKDPTIALHNLEEMTQRFEYSLLLTLDDDIIGHASLYPTHMKPLTDEVILDNRKTNVGELGSCAIDPNHQHLKLGTQLVTNVMDEYMDKFGVIISATINPYFTQLAEKLGFDTSYPFPQEYYEEGKKYLAPSLPGGLQEFEQKATFLVKTPLDYKTDLLSLLTQSYATPSTSL